MTTCINVYKPVGYTPLELIQQLKITNPQYKNELLGYAGRLDPMAEGVLLVLVGDENKKRKEYERLTKQYTFTVLFGIETDTYDIMGLITNVKTDNKKLEFSDLAASYIGSWNQQYPPYSSPRVNGKPLFYWARNNLLDTIQLPSKQIHVESLGLMSTSSIDSIALKNYVHSRISKVQGDFRQQEILNCWDTSLTDSLSFRCATFTISCSSGAYVRSIAHDMGIKMGTGAIALSIERTAVGSYRIQDTLRIMDTS